jgi:hypothetical protein
VNTFGVIELEVSGSVCLVNTLGLVIEYNRVKLGSVYYGGGYHLFCCFEVVIQEALSPVDRSTGVSALHELVHKPLQDREKHVVIQTFNLMGKELEGTLHELKALHDLFRQAHPLAQIEVIFKVEVNVIVTTSDGPAHATQDLVEGVNGETRTEVASRDE